MQRNVVTVGTIIAILVLLPFTPAQAQTFLGKGPLQWRQVLENSSEAASRRNAAFALGKLGNLAQGEMGALIAALANDSDPAVKEAAAFAIGDICRNSRDAASAHHKKLIPLLAGILSNGDNDPMLRRSAAYALGCLGKQGRKLKTINAALQNALGALDRGVSDPHPAVKQNSAWALGFLGPSAVLSLRKALGDNDPAVVRDAANSLADLGKDARPALAELLRHCQHPNGEVQKAVMLALVDIVNENDADTVARPLQAVLQDPHTPPEVQRNAAFALGNIGGEQAVTAVPVLVDVLKSGTLEDRRLAAAAIRNIGPKAAAAVPDLMKALSDRDEKVRRNAAVALGGIAENAAPAVPKLVKVFAKKSEEEEVRIEAAVALRHIGACPEAVKCIPTLMQIMADRDNPIKVRTVAMWPLRVHGVALARHNKVYNIFPVLNDILENERPTEANKMLRYDCAHLLGVFVRENCSKKVMDTLLEYLHDDDLYIYGGTVTVTSGSGQEKGVGGANVKKLKKGDGRRNAVQALRFIANGDTQKVLQRQDIMNQLNTLLNTSNDADLKKELNALMDQLN